MKQDLKCKSCDRHLGWAYGSIVAELICPNSACKATNHFKIIRGDTSEDIRFKFAKPERPPKAKQVEVS